MRANKIFFDLFSTSGGTLPHEEYVKWYNKHDTVYTALRDAGIYTKIAREEMFKKGMWHGCFLESCPYRTPEEVREGALRFAKDNDLTFVDPDEFIRIEETTERERVAKAFAIAERMIANG